MNHHPVFGTQLTSIVFNEPMDSRQVGNRQMPKEALLEPKGTEAQSVYLEHMDCIPLPGVPGSWF